jgi:hypothetical protein
MFNGIATFYLYEQPLSSAQGRLTGEQNKNPMINAVVIFMMINDFDE